MPNVRQIFLSRRSAIWFCLGMDNPGNRFAKNQVAHYFLAMSATEIINELPKLTEAELRSVRQRLLELAAQNEEIECCNQAAMDGAAMLDRMEEDDARRQRR